MSTYKPGRPVKYIPDTGAGTKPPSLPGEYRIRDASGKLLYIGETGDLSRRTGEHIRSGKLPSGGLSSTRSPMDAQPPERAVSTSGKKLHSTSRP